MKYLTLLITFFTASIFAQEVPDYLKDGVITVTLKNGKVYKFSSNEYMVVKRGASKKAKEVAPVAKKQANKNNLSFMMGTGYKHNTVKYNASSVEVKDKLTPVMGVSYSRKISPDQSVIGTIFTNATVGVGLGLDF